MDIMKSTKMNCADEQKHRCHTVTVRNNDSETNYEKPNLKGDWLNFSLLLLLYTMQGLPLGIINGIPLIMQSKNNVTYQEQALFTLVGVPYCIKLLWAPLVDTFYVQKLGRRKSWLIPVQFLIGMCFIYIASDIDNILPEKGIPKIKRLVYIFSICTFLITTQDIVVDGWALTILKKKNVGYASTCNTSGIAIGLMIGTICSTLLTSKKFSNKYLWATPHEEGMTTLKDLFRLLGVFYLLVTILIAVFKKEKDCTLSDGYVKLNIQQNYTLLFKTFKLRSVQKLAIALLTAKIGFAATESVTSLQLIDYGVSKDDIAVINTGMYAVKMIIPFFTAKYTAGSNSINVYLLVIFIRLCCNIPFVIIIYEMTNVKNIADHDVYFQFCYYLVLVFMLLVQEVLTYIIFISILSFFYRISDLCYGGTYMTLLNTLLNLGNSWTSYIALAAIDYLTVKTCSTHYKRNDNPLYLEEVTHRSKKIKKCLLS
ncbi:Hypothetical protein CINCED_3A008525 [Cinara cedri]|uniref:Major facilitator superfamily domain,Acetyl-coenzyme A transporter 1 n=1 Tax=Cinara cedri TaxID=506608 RepID=A0A5E4MVV7_9HEMI|nr:Hypothetical protein CINCED_3A008525 [Cinara cedri]